MKRLPISLNALRAFEAAARLGRMTEAAAELNVTHGAISRQVKTLEDALGTRLFEGPRNRPTLTAAGARLLPDLTAGFDRIDAGLRAVADSEAGTLDVSCTGTLLMRWLIPRLHRFTSARSDIEVRLSASADPVDFRTARFDLAIRVGHETEQPPETRATPLFAEATGPVMAPDLSVRAALETPQDATRLPRLHTATRPAAWTEWAGNAGLPAEVVASLGPGPGEGHGFDHFYFMLEATNTGLGVAVAPWQLVFADVAAGRLVAPLGFIPTGLTYMALSRRSRSRKVDVFLDWLIAEAATMPPPPAGPAAAPPRPPG